MAQVLAFKRVVKTALVLNDSRDLFRIMENMKNYIEEKNMSKKKSGKGGKKC